MSGSVDLDYDFKLSGYGVSTASPKPILDVLVPGEKILWSGRPSQHLVIFRPTDLYNFFVSLVVLGFMLFWEVMVFNSISSGQIVKVSSPVSSGEITGPFNYIFLLSGLPFVLIGLYLLFGRYIFDAIIRRRTYYALTDRRVILWSDVWWRSLQSLPLEKIESVDLIQHWGGSGSITFFGSMLWGGKFGARMMYYSSGISNRSYGYRRIPVFDHIAEPKKVYDQVLEAQDKRIASQQNNDQKN